MNVCHPYFEKFQIFDSYASRKGKGTHAAIKRARKYSERYSWFLKLDVRKFFASVDHKVLKEQLNRRFKDQRLLSIFAQIIDSFQEGVDRGIPIGNLSSQYFANHYLAVDHFIKEELRAKAYVRYMDDMVIWSNDKASLKLIRDQIISYTTEKLKCKLKPEILNLVGKGLPFLGYKVFPEKLLLNQRSKQRFKRKLKEIESNFQSGKWTEAECQRKILPLLSFVCFASSFGFRTKALNYA